MPELLFMQLKAAEQQHEQIGSSTGNAALASLQEKESAMQAIAMQLFNKRLQLMKENNSLEVKMPLHRLIMLERQCIMVLKSMHRSLGSISKHVMPVE